jgi:hypothetical protein
LVLVLALILGFTVGVEFTVGIVGSGLSVVDFFDFATRLNLDNVDVAWW